MSTLVAGNRIGTDITGTLEVPNFIGVFIGHSPQNTIGGTVSGDSNLISGNSGYGVYLYGSETTDTIVVGNRIGTDITGTLALPNNFGVGFGGGASDNTVGGSGAGTSNLISGNSTGVAINSSGDNVIAGNEIGTDITGTLALANQIGVSIYNGALGNTIGGVTGVPGTGTGNLISGNAVYGVDLNFADDTVIAGNLIGTDITGTLALGNGRSDVGIEGGATGNTIGGAVAGAGNVISGTDSLYLSSGVRITGSSTIGNVVAGDLIGTDITGSFALPDHDGVYIDNAPDNLVGGSVSGAGNLISGNTNYGVYLYGSSTTGIIVVGNQIGTDITGTRALPNAVGISIKASPDNTIGGSVSGDSNLISGNASSAIFLDGPLAMGNVVAGNRIGTDITGTLALGNASGILDDGAPDNTIGGTVAGARNLISGNTNDGVQISSPVSSGVVVAGNLIGTDITGTLALPNSIGVFIDDASGDMIGGTTSGAGNLISGDTDDGIYLYGSATSGTTIAGNQIGTDITGTLAVPDHIGIYDIGAPQNTIGGTTAGAGNLISGDTAYGIEITSASAYSNLIEGNRVGTDTSGTVALPNYIGISISSSDNTIGGSTSDGAGNMISGNSSEGIQIFGSNSGNVVAGNRIGTDTTGTLALGNYIDVVVYSPDNTIGGTASGEGNVISGSPFIGLWLDGPSSTGNVVVNDMIGTDITGTVALANYTGLQIDDQAADNTVGGTTAGTSNLISGNASFGVAIDGASYNVVEGNLIGTDITGTAALPDVFGGVAIEASATGNTIGGSTTTPGTAGGNLISGNTGDGLYISGNGTSYNVIAGNLIGTDITGAVALGDVTGVVITGVAAGNTVGGSAAGAENVISGNSVIGVNISGSASNVVEGNRIGTDITGTVAIPDGTGLVLNQGARGNTIGGATAGEGNVISGNTIDGVSITDAGTTDNVIAGNRIGTDITGTVALGNADGGVAIQASATGNTIGGSALGYGNVISGNADGVSITGSGTIENVIAGNMIGTDITGTLALPDAIGVSIAQGASDNTIGGQTSTPGTGAGNLISGNLTASGVEIVGAGTTGNVVAGNLIGTDITGTLALPNEYGVQVANAAGNLIGGTVSGDANLISGNSLDGIYLYGFGTTGTTVAGNRIGTDITGTLALSNSTGVFMDGGASGNTVGGSVLGTGNLISGNNYGVFLNGASGNVVAGNLIGTDITGTLAVLNNMGVEFFHSSDNTIGGTTTGEGNLISGNAIYAVYLYGPTTTGTIVVGNKIGTDITGTLALANDTGVQIAGGASLNTIGEAVPGAGNLISGNITDGVHILESGSNVIAGNLIGTDVTGTFAVDNGYAGVFLEDGPGNKIGGDVSGDGNLISGNAYYGIMVDSLNTTGVVIAGNKIGTDITGTVALPNGSAGVYFVAGPSDDTIGGSSAARGT